MTDSPADRAPRSSADSAKWLRRSARRQALAAVMLAAFSMFSPAPDLRPKPILPVKYQMARPADPPELDLDVLPSRDCQPPVHAATAHAHAPSLNAAAGLPSFHPFRSEEAKASYTAMYDAGAREWPVPSEDLFVRGDFGETYVRVSGPRDAPPLVLLHGISSSSLSWMPNIARLARAHRVYAVDHVHDGGRSTWTRPLLSAEDHVAWLDGLFDGLGLDTGVNLGGLSYGGWLAARYALSHAERLRKLVLIAPAAMVQPLSGEWVARAVACAIPLPFFTRSFLRWLLRDLAERSAALHPNFDEVARDAFMTLRCLAPHKMVPPTVLTDDELRRLALPVLFLVGRNEKICSPLEAIARLNAVVPQVRTRLIDNAGHDLTLVQAEKVDHAVLEFLAQPAVPRNAERSTR